MTNPNEPIYPCQFQDVDQPNKNIALLKDYTGLSKREYFAGLAMQGFCSYEPKESMDIADWEKKWANTACRIADALIAALNK